MSGLLVTPYISDQAVLQRNEFITIRGTAAPGERVEAVLASAAAGVGYRLETEVEVTGKWKVMFMPMKSGGPYTITVTCKAETVVFSDIYIGDVWLMSGQSNMQLPMERVKYRFPKEYETDGDALVRQFTIPIQWDFKAPAEELSGGAWEHYTPACAGYFSAVGYFFGTKLRERYGVPIGLILTGVGGTPIEAWMSKTALSAFPGKLGVAEPCKSDAYVTRIQAEDEARAADWYQRLDAGDSGISGAWQTVRGEDDWKEINLTDDFSDNADFYEPGSVWFKKVVTIPAELSGQPFRLSMGTIKDADFTYVDGQLAGNITYRYPPREYHLEGLSEGDHEITIRALALTPGLVFTKGKKHRLIFEKGSELSISDGWKYRRGVSMEPLDPPVFFQRKPLGLYQSMIAPLHDFPICGMCWYQGEINADDNETYPQYPQYFERMIADYRRKWHMGKFPVLYVQLPNYDMEDAVNWVQFRNLQQRLAKQPNCAMVVTIDCGEVNDLHPTDKKTVGERLAMAAYELAYHEPGEWLSPVFTYAMQRDEEVILYFEHGESGLMIPDGGANGFEVCLLGEWTSEGIHVRTEENTVILRVSAGKEITAVRYAWSNNPVNARLSAVSGLRVSPFMTEV